MSRGSGRGRGEGESIGDGVEGEGRGRGRGGCILSTNDTHTESERVMCHWYLYVVD